jgi:hypothetical protein
MADFPAEQERLLKQLISTMRCEVCRRGFEGEHVRVAARHEQLWIVSVRCGQCRNQQVFWVAIKDREGQTTLLRDVSDDEEEQFAALPAVTSNDVLDMHEFLSNFNGDFKRLFAR